MNHWKVFSSNQRFVFSVILVYCVAGTKVGTLLLPSSECCRLLGMFAELRKATIGSVMSVRPSVRMEQFGFHRTYIHENFENEKRSRRKL